MRVLNRLQARRRACVLAWMFLAAGTATPAAAQPPDAEVLREGASLTIDLSSVDEARVIIAPGSDPVLVEIEQRFVELAVDASSPREGKTTLQSINADVIPILWLLKTRPAAPAHMTLRVLSRSAPRVEARVRMTTLAAAEIGAAEAESRLSVLPDGVNSASLAQAREHALSAALQWQQLGADQSAGRARLAASSLSLQLDDHSAALTNASAALALLNASGDKLGVGLARNAIGLASIEMRDFETARNVLPVAVSELSPFYDRGTPSPAECNLCYLDFRSGSFSTAKPCYESVIDRAEAAGDEKGVARHENNLAGVYWNLGETSLAARTLERALSRPGSDAPTLERSRRLSNLGLSLKLLGRPQEALVHYEAALGIAREIDNQAQVERVLRNLAITYGDLGSPHQALPFLQEQYELRKANRSIQAARVANNYAGALAATGEYDQAADILVQTISLANQLSDADVLATSQRLAAQTALLRRDVDKAVDFAKAAVKSATSLGETSRTRARALVALGRALTASENPREAIEPLSEALRIWRNVGNPYGEVAARAGLGWALRESGDLVSARQQALSTVEQIERLRATIASPDLRASYQSDVAEVYELAIYCLLDANDESEALIMAERFRAKVLIDMLSRAGGDTGAGAPEALLQEREDIIATINRAENDRLRGREAPDISPLLLELDAVEERIAAAEPRFASLRTTQPLAIDALQALHGDGEGTLVYFLGREAGVAWLVEAQRVRAVRLEEPIEIDAIARKLHEELSRRGSGYGIDANALGERLLAPLADPLRQLERVAIVGDKALHYTPFDVLTVGARREPLLQEKSIAYLPSLTSLSIARAVARTNGRNVTVIADPVFDPTDARVADTATKRGAAAQLNRLRMTRKEAQAIRAAADGVNSASQATEPITVSVHTDFAARAALLRDEAVIQAAVLHIATHGFANDEIPARSGIALSMVDEDGGSLTGFVGLRDIYELQLHADLVVLSACETALGRNLSGEGLLGLTRGFMYAGARRVVATLWRVEDRATAELMSEFYKRLFEGASPAEALVAAKGALRRSGRFRHPYYWSAFTLQGDWRVGPVR